MSKVKTIKQIQRDLVRKEANFRSLSCVPNTNGNTWNFKPLNTCPWYPVVIQAGDTWWRFPASKAAATKRVPAWLVASWKKRNTAARMSWV